MARDYPNVTSVRVRDVLATVNTLLKQINQAVSAAASADRILVIEDGRPAGVGTHTELLRTCELYRDITMAQLGKEAVDGEDPAP